MVDKNMMAKRPDDGQHDGEHTAFRARPVRRRGRLSGPTFLAALLLTSSLLAGCGYALVGRGSNLPEDIAAVFVRPLENRTPRGEIEQFLTQAIAEELVNRAKFQLASSEAEADAVLRGEVISFRVTPITFDAEGRGDEYEISITTRVAFVRTDEDETAIWANDRYVFKENYDLGGDAVDFFDRENLAIEESSVRFAETMVIDLLQGF